MSKIVLYTTHCPKCIMLEAELKKKGIEYDTVTDINVMKEKGMMFSPALEVNGEIMDFDKAKKWLSK